MSRFVHAHYRICSRTHTSCRVTAFGLTRGSLSSHLQDIPPGHNASWAMQKENIGVGVHQGAALQFEAVLEFVRRGTDVVHMLLS
jgi:hypothetical protein